MDNQTLIYGIIFIVYLFIILILGYKGFRDTKSASDYMVGGRKINPYIMALSYGATFISTSAIVGFGGLAAQFGFGLLWLTFFNIFAGIFIAFIFFGKKTRQIGHKMDSHTFPEFLGSRFQSRFIQGFMGILIFIMMPLYAAAVLIGAAKFIEVTFSIPYDWSLIFFTVIIALYVLMGGLKGVMYTDALQGSVMLLSMIILVFMVYSYINDLPRVERYDENPISAAHHALEDLTIQDEEGNYTHLTNIDITEENVGYLQNIWLDNFKVHTFEEAVAKINNQIESATESGDQKKVDDLTKALNATNAIATGDPEKITGLSVAMNTGFAGFLSSKLGWDGFTGFPDFNSVFWWVLFSSIVMGVGIGVLAQPQLAVRFMTVKSNRELNRAVLIGGIFIMFLTGGIFVVGALSNVFFFNETGLLTINLLNKSVESVIPAFLKEFMPSWFGAVFMITILAAAMSTLSSQFHVMGTSIGRDVYEKIISKKQEPSVMVNRVGILLAILFSLLIAYGMPKVFSWADGIIARATAMFFGLCACAFLPMYFCALYTKKVSKRAVIMGMLFGFFGAFLWILLVHEKESALFGLAQLISDGPTLAVWFDSEESKSMLRYVDPLFIGLPLSIIFTLIGHFIFPAKNEEIQYAQEIMK